MASHVSPSKSALLVASMDPSPHPVPLRLLHLLRLPLGGENQTGTKGSHSSLSDGLLGVPHSHKNVVKEGLHLLEEESGDTDGQLTENEDLGEKDKQNSYSFRDFCSLRTLPGILEHLLQGRAKPRPPSWGSLVPGEAKEDRPSVSVLTTSC